LNRRVVITGVGLVSPIGIGVKETWESLLAGKSGVGEITRFDVSNYQKRPNAPSALLHTRWQPPVWPSKTPDWLLTVPTPLESV
jgi:3-oxoacyl-(acyl-carrier-protein) synthase